jgi:geranylgeranyl diphosphate synthase, type II
MINLSQYQSQYQTIIDEKLDSLLQAAKDLFPPLHEAMRYAVFSGGKRIRPLLVLAAAESVGGSGQNAVAPAAAVELMHTYTLVHDDLPSMDNDDLRRGQPTAHVKFGEANALLAGDALQALAFLALADHAAASRLTQELGQAGVGVVAGQWADLAASQESLTEADIEFIHEHKTATILRASVRMGGISGEATDEQLAALTLYGTAVGHLFQLIDDLLDAEADDKASALAVYGKDGARQRAHGYLQTAQDSLRSLPSPEVLAAIAQFIFERTV